MAKVTDIQDEQGTVKEIQDKDLSRQTAQSSIASSDYIMLEDTDGGYHKISKASFTEAVRGALGSVINSVAKGTDIAKVPVLDSNNDLGMGTLQNLASVLGVAGPKGVVNVSWNNLDAGVYWINSLSGEGAPAGTIQYGVLLVFKSLENRVVQIYYPHSSDLSVLAVHRVYYDGSWTNWI